jgi:hypothetical protein
MLGMGEEKSWKFFSSPIPNILRKTFAPRFSQLSIATNLTIQEIINPKYFFKVQKQVSQKVDRKQT